MIWKVYKSSWLATIVSIAGAGCIYGGIICLISGQILPALICLAIGVAFYLLAEKIAANAVFKAWKKEVVSKGYAQMIAQGNLSVAAHLYQQNPGEKTLQYLETLNPCVVSSLRGGTNTASAQQAVPGNTRQNPQDSHFCSNCGSRLEDSANFCASCGRRI